MLHREHKCFLCGKQHPMWQCHSNKLKQGNGQQQGGKKPYQKKPAAKKKKTAPKAT